MARQQRRTFKKPLVMTDRIEVRCSQDEKDTIYAAALSAGQPVSRFLVESTLMRIVQSKAVVNHG